MKKVLTVGIAGGSGSGKTTITEMLKSRFKGRVAVINHDNYYRARHELTYEERTKINYDSPDAFETSLMVEHLRLLNNWEAVECPVYDFTIHDRSDKVFRIEPAEVLIIDGILVLADPALRACMDIKIFVDTDADIRILRRILRDVNERGRSLESVIEQYIKTVKPMHEAYVEPSKKFADVVIPEGGHNLIAVEMVEQRILSHLESNK